jgi:integrase/recombinase XerD
MLFAKCDAEERLRFEFFLMSGMREQEVMHCSWPDIKFSRGTVTVRYSRNMGSVRRTTESARSPSLRNSSQA